MEIYTISALIIGSILGFIVGRIGKVKQMAPVDISTRLIELEKGLAVSEEGVRQITEQRTVYQRKCDELQSKVNELTMTTTRQESERKSVQEGIESQKEELKNIHGMLQLKFQDLATKILEETSAKSAKMGQQNLSALIDPLKEKLQMFQKQVQDTVEKDTRDRVVLQVEVKRMQELNTTLTKEAAGLAQALKGDKKSQGNWGEIVLERILEAAGLRDGMEFVRQGSNLGLKDSENKQQKPDIVIRLPDSKHLIVDSKVTLVSWDRYIQAQTPEEQKKYAEEFVAAIEAHVEGLSGKKYEANGKLDTPEFVFMFMPLEANFATALSTRPDLFEKAWKARVIIVGPTNLLAALKTVATLWVQERQNLNTRKIVDQGAKLHDQFVAFTVDLQDVGTKLDKAKESWDSAFKRLTSGRDNLVKQVSTLKSLGVTPKKNLPDGLVEVALDDSDDESSAA